MNTTTYFSDSGYVSKLRTATLGKDSSCDLVTNAGPNWLFHELRHMEQCSELGGRDVYAEP